MTNRLAGDSGVQTPSDTVSGNGKHALATPARKSRRIPRASSTRKRKLRAKAREGPSKYPRHSLEKSLRIPRAILEQNAGRECTDQQAAEFAGVGLHGPTAVEIGSGIKYGLLERPRAGSLALTSLGKQILKPQKDSDELDGLRKAALTAPVISEVYAHYRGENLPDQRFLQNALTETFRIPSAKVPEFLIVFLETLRLAKLLDESGDKRRILDVSHSGEPIVDSGKTLERFAKRVTTEDETCFVLMPFASPHGEYYAQIYEKAIEKAGLRAVRADAELFGTGKIIDQIWRGMNGARVLVAELTTRNPNVFYELGLAHALNKPVVLVSANEADVPFDLRHIRVIYYDMSDPFWGQKLVDKVAENIRSALDNPEDALFKRALAAQSS